MIRFVSIFAAGFFISLHYGVILYINSSFLSKFFQPDTVSLLFLLGAIGNIFLFLFAPKLIERLGKYTLLLTSLVLTAITTAILAFVSPSFIVAVSFVAWSSFLSMVPYLLDIFLEEVSEDAKTGGIRGAYLTFLNIGIALGPFTLAFLAREDSLKLVYVASALLLIPPIILSLFFIKSRFPLRHRLHRYVLLPFKLWWRTKSVRRATLARLSLNIFFAFMIIYMPLYLHEVLHFEWSVIGIMFTIMLLPFIIFQWPVGEFADRFVGEKEFMIIGFLIMGTSLLLMPYLGTSVVVWTVVLFLSRVGASFVEVTSESYFFKHVDPSETGLLSIYRLTNPLSVVLGTTVGVLALNLFSFEKMFFILAIIIFFGLKESLLLRDTL